MPVPFPPPTVRPLPHRLIARDVQCLTSHFTAWRESTVAHRPSAADLALVHRHLLRSVWNRWSRVWTQQKIQHFRYRHRLSRLSSALLRWRTRGAERKADRAQTTRIQQLLHTHLLTRCMRQWSVQYHSHVNEQRMMGVARVHCQQTILPRVLRHWLHYSVVSSRTHHAAHHCTTTRSRRLCQNAMHEWQVALSHWRAREEAAASHLLLFRLKGVVGTWRVWVHRVREVTIESPVMVHSLFVWTSISFDHPLPYATSLPSSLCPALKRSRVTSFSGHREKWRMWMLRRVWEVWQTRALQWRMDHTRTRTIRQSSECRLLRSSFLLWREERQAQLLQTRLLTSTALHRWHRWTQQRQHRAERLRTAGLVHRFHLQTFYFTAWKRRHAQSRLHQLHQQSEVQRQAAEAAEEGRLVQRLEDTAIAFDQRKAKSAALIQWRRWVLHHLLMGCTAQLVQARWEERAKEGTVQWWREWKGEKTLRRQLRKEREDKADVMYVGRLLSVLLVCWRLQLQRKRQVQRMQERRRAQQTKALMERWREFVLIRREERRVEREVEDRKRKEEDRKKAALVSRFVLYAAWRQWRRLMSVVDIGQAVASRRQRHRMQQVWEMWVKATTARQARRRGYGEMMQEMVSRYVEMKREEETTRLVQRHTAEVEIRRRRRARIFSRWKAAGLADLGQRQRALALHRQLLLRSVWTTWTTTTTTRLSPLLLCESRVRERVRGHLLQEAMRHWRWTLYLRGVVEGQEGDVVDFPAFIHWRRATLHRMWRVWRQVTEVETLDRRADAWRQSRTIHTTLRLWHRKAHMHTLLTSYLHTHTHALCSAALNTWVAAMRTEVEERQAVAVLTPRLVEFRSPAVGDIGALLMGCARSSYPARGVGGWFRVWWGVVCEVRREERWEAVAVQWDERRRAGQVMSHWWKRLREERRRQEWREGIERGLDALLLQGVWVRWRRAREGLSRRYATFIVRRAFWTWKLQARRVRERRQLLIQAEVDEGA